MNAKDNFILRHGKVEQQRNNKEITKREQRKEIDGSNHEFENFENIYIYCKTKLELSRYRYFS